MKHSVVAVSLAALVVALVACGDDPSTDAATDAATDTGGMDSAADSRPIDAGMVCEPSCDMTQRCCDDGSGGVTCINSSSDPNNCGGCDIVCADGRGSSCRLSACVCGRVVMGCGGVERSWCCPPRDPGATEYCADLTNDSQDCGDCNNRCAPETSSNCRLGDCVCGDTLASCAGTPEDLCCADVRNVFACVDTLTDFFHCGGCGEACETGFRCEAGICVIGASCTGVCEPGQVCCEGSCCSRTLCTPGGGCA